MFFLLKFSKDRLIILFKWNDNITKDACCYFYETHILKESASIYFCEFRVSKNLILVKSVKIQTKTKE